MDQKPIDQSGESSVSTRRMHPLGPVLVPVSGLSRSQIRVRALFVLIGGLGLISLSLYLKPDSHGVGTHRQLGFPECGMVRMFNFPCPTCGMTTSFAWTIRGNLVQGFHAQPFGMLLAFGTFGGTLAAAYVLVTARFRTINWYRVSIHKTFLVFAILFLLGWLYKIADMRDWL